MKKGILIILTHLFILTIFAQEDNCPEPKKKAVKLFEEAKLSFSKRYGLLIEATKIDPNYLEAYNELADINGKKANNARSAQSQTQHNNRMLEYLKKIIEICPEYRGYYASMTMGGKSVV